MRPSWILAAAVAAGLACSKSSETSKAPPSSGGSAGSAAPERPKPSRPAPVAVAQAGDGQRIERVVVVDGHVYWIEGTTEGTRTSYLMQLRDGAVHSSTATSHAVAADEGFVSYNGPSNHLARRPHAGGDPETIAPLGDLAEIAVAGGAVFAIDRARVKDASGAYQDHAVMWRVVPGQEPTRLVEATRLSGLVVHADRIYVVRDGQVVGIGVDGKDERVYGTGTAPLHADDRHVYAQTADRISRFPVGGGPAEPFVAGHVLIGGDRDHVYASTETEVVAIDKQSKASTLLLAEGRGALAAVRGSDGVYLNQHLVLFRVGAP